MTSNFEAGSIEILEMPETNEKEGQKIASAKMGDFLGSFRILVKDKQGNPLPYYPVIAIVDRKESAQT